MQLIQCFEDDTVQQGWLTRRLPLAKARTNKADAWELLQPTGTGALAATPPTMQNSCVAAAWLRLHTRARGAVCPSRVGLRRGCQS